MPAPVDITDPFRALSDPTRREIVSLLAEGPLPVRMIAARFPAISRPAVSKHLRILREGRVVREEKRGRERFYSLSPETVASVEEWLAGISAAIGSRAASPAPSKPKPTPSRAESRPRTTPTAESAAAPASEVAAEPDDWKTW